MSPAEPPPPPLRWLMHLAVEVGDVVSLGVPGAGSAPFNAAPTAMPPGVPPGVPPGAPTAAPTAATAGTGAGPERRVVALTGGQVTGVGDWQRAGADGVLDIDAHDLIETDDGAHIEVRSRGLRHGPPEVMAALARGEPVPGQAYFFRTFVRLHTGHPAWQQLNRVMAVAVGRREARQVLLDLYELG